MRQICKSAEPLEFSEWKQRNQAATFSDLGNGDNFALKQAIKNSLLAEQQYLCCYCENEINASSKSSHIEHLLPQSTCPQKQLDYDNLLASCNADNRKAHCGHKKGQKILPFTPLDDASQINQRFIFAADGHIYPRDTQDSDAQYAISILGLDAQRLVTMRNAAISTLIPLLVNSPEERQQTLDALSPANEKLYAFHSAIRCQIDQLTTFQLQ